MSIMGASARNPHRGPLTAPAPPTKGSTVKLQGKVPTLVVALSLAATGLVFLPSTATASSPRPSARPGAPYAPKIVRLKSSDKKVTVSDTRFRPGVTEFRVTKTAHRGSSVVILKSKDLDKAFKKLGIAFGGGTGSADAMAAFDRLVTIYGGGAQGSRWQVNLTHGTHYYAFDIKTNQLTPIKVKGDRRSAKMQHADSAIWAYQQNDLNQFTTDGKLEGNWVSFENKAHEIHFMEAERVAQGTTARDVRQALKSNKDPKWIRPGGFFFDVQSPGIKTVHYQEVKPGRYLIICFMPSEMQDGVPHALMGMYHLVNAV